MSLFVNRISRILNVGNTCNMCGRTIPKKDVLEQASKQVPQRVFYIETDENLVCPTCVNEYIQYKRIDCKEQSLLMLYQRTCKMFEYNWSSQLNTVETQAYVKKLMLNDITVGSVDIQYLNKPIKYRVIDIKKFNGDYRKTSNDVMGVSFPQGVDITKINPIIIDCPSDCIGLIKLPQGNDFIIIENSNSKQLCKLEMSLNEMKSISSGEMSSRAGAAGGFKIPSIKSRSLSVSTQSERILSARKNSVAMSVTYRNKEGFIKGYNSVYNDLYMKRYNSAGKFNASLRSHGYRSVLITEMISRLRSFMLLDHIGYHPLENTLFSFLLNTEKRKRMEEKFITAGCSKFESIMLSWACSSGEMRNHQAVKAHVDGNKSHPVETYSLLGRIPINKRPLGVQSLIECTDGYLILPLEGATIRLRCGQDLIHCSMKKTIHLADNSRNSCNWSRVHGP